MRAPSILDYQWPPVPVTDKKPVPEPQKKEGRPSRPLQYKKAPETYTDDEEADQREQGKKMENLRLAEEKSPYLHLRKIVLESLQKAYPDLWFPMDLAKHFVPDNKGKTSVEATRILNKMLQVINRVAPSEPEVGIDMLKQLVRDKCTAALAQAKYKQ